MFLLSDYLYKLRKTRNITLQTLSLYTGISMASLSAYERGKYTPSLENLCKIATYYGVSLDEMLGRNE